MLSAPYIVIFSTQPLSTVPNPGQQSSTKCHLQVTEVDCYNPVPNTTSGQPSSTISNLHL